MDIRLVDRSAVHVEWEWEEEEDAQGYEVSRTKTGDGDPWERLAIVFVHQFADTGLEPGTKYSYKFEPLGMPEDDIEILHVQTNPEKEFADSKAFFMEFLASVFARVRGEQSAWCVEWWRHPEAAYVVEQLWMSYEAAVMPGHGEPSNAKATWLVYFGYPLTDRLFNSSNTFKGCMQTTSNPGHHEPVMKSPRLPHRVDPTGEYPVDVLTG
jgi:hypothetical protein